MEKETNYTHWHLIKDDANLIWLSIDVKDKSTNVLSEEVLLELEVILDSLPPLEPKGLIVQSGKENGFIAGADITAFTKISTKQEALHLITTGQKILLKLEQLPFPTLALISGFCLGGGFELALACDYRIAADTPATKIGLPEVKLGIHPGFGGTVRLNNLIGGVKALPLMMAGKILDSRKAKRLGMVDQAVPERLLIAAAKKTVLANKRIKKRTIFTRLLDSFFLRPILARFFLSNLKKKVIETQYPAPFALLDLWRKGGSCVCEKMYTAEAESVAELILHPTAKNLTRIFFLQEKMKGQQGDDSFSAKRVHVVGGGVMGGDIAAWCALSGLHVTVQDQHAGALTPLMKRARKLFTFKLKQRHLVQAAMDRLQPDVKGDGIEKADVIIEAIFENAEAKKTLFASLEPRMKATAVLATNTSSIPLENLSENLQRPERLIGLHFFNPVARMQLVEVVHTKHTEEEFLLKGVQFAKQIKKLPVPTMSSPGFLVNRILMPYLHEAALMAEENISLPHIDKAAVAFGMPIGPIELIDMVGLDICQSVSDFLQQENLTMPPSIGELVEKGYTGKKSSRGLYKYKNGKPKKKNAEKEYTPPVDIEDRLILRLLNECAACLRENIVANKDMLDGGLIFGTGFAPFRGGPIHYMELEKEELYKKLKQLENTYGQRFKPNQGWEMLE